MMKKKAALCFRGAMSKTSGQFTHPGALYHNPSPYVNYMYAYNSIMRHIVKANPDYDVDIFIHCWNPDLEKELVALYKPTRYIFEDNRVYNEEITSLCKGPPDFGGISHALSLKKSLELQEKYSAENNITYDIVILFRPDVLIWKDMLFPKYDLTNFYIDGCPNYNGEMYYVMSPQHALLFKDLYLSLKAGNRYVTHAWTKTYLLNYCKIPIRMDDIIPGTHIEVLRKVNGYSALLKDYK